MQTKGTLKIMVLQSQVTPLESEQDWRKFNLPYALVTFMDQPHHGTNLDGSLHTPALRDADALRHTHSEHFKISIDHPEDSPVLIELFETPVKREKGKKDRIIGQMTTSLSELKADLNTKRRFTLDSSSSAYAKTIKELTMDAIVHFKKKIIQETLPSLDPKEQKAQLAANLEL